METRCNLGSIYWEEKVGARASLRLRSNFSANWFDGKVAPLIECRRVPEPMKSARI